MIIVLWLARALWRVSLVAKRAGDWLYSHCFSRELRRLERESDEKARASQRRTAAVIEDVIAETRHVRAPIHRDR